jgi:selT/selW/selH-like putative selenoprotein
LAAELKSHFGADAELIASHNGVFEVSVDGKLVFSKRSLARFPNDGEVLDLIRSLPS